MCVQRVMATLPPRAMLQSCLRTAKCWRLLSRDVQDALLDQGLSEVALFSLAFEPTNASAVVFLGTLGVGLEEDVQVLLDMQAHAAPLARIEERRLAAVSDTDIVLHHAARAQADLVRPRGADLDDHAADSHLKHPRATYPPRLKRSRALEGDPHARAKVE